MEARFQCGFGDYSNFLKAFKREFGKTPSKYNPPHKVILPILSFSPDIAHNLLAHPSQFFLNCIWHCKRAEYQKYLYLS